MEISLKKEALCSPEILDSSHVTKQEIVNLNVQCKIHSSIFRCVETTIWEKPFKIFFPIRGVADVSSMNETN
jgi:hypothetical protein